MKKTMFTLILALIMPVIAFGYSSGQGNDPSAYPDMEFKSVAQPSASSSTIAVGTTVVYNPSSIDGYTITTWSSPTALNARQIACIATQNAIATAGAYSICAVRGFVNGALYDTTGAFGGFTTQIARGDYLCVNGQGKLTSCYAGGGTAAFASPSTITALDPAPSNATGKIRILIQSQ